MLKNNIEIDVKVKCVEEQTKQAELVEKTGISPSNINRLIRNPEKGASGSGTYNVKVMFPDGKPGMYDQFGWSASENGLEDLIIETYILNEDCTVTFSIYVPKSYPE